MRRAIIAVLVLGGCSQQSIQQVGLHQYTVTGPSKQLFAKANETCSKLGRLMVAAGTRVEDVRPNQLRFECRLPYEIVPVDQGSYRIWVPVSEIPVAKPGETSVPMPKVQVPGEPTVEDRFKQRASEYCAKMSKVTEITGGFLDLGYGMDLTFRCVPRQ
jgi:hypothetical protein